MSTHAHSFCSDAKDNWRTLNRRFYELYGPFPGAIVETSGTTAWKSFDEQKHLIYRASQFVMVENRMSTFLDARMDLLARYPDKDQRPLLANGDICTVTMDMFRKNQPVSACCLDLLSSAGDEAWWRDTGPVIWSMIQKGVEVLGNFCLIMNHTLDLPMEDPKLRSERVRTHTRCICKWFQQWEVSPERLLGAGPSKQAEAVENSRMVGQLGAFQVYRGEDHKLRMLTIRLSFNREVVKIDQEPRS